MGELVIIKYCGFCDAPLRKNGRCKNCGRDRGQFLHRKT